MLNSLDDMRKTLFVLFTTLLSILCSVESFAQVFPVQSRVNLIPPYSGNFADYISPGSQRISVTLSSNDANLFDYRVKLRLTIEGLGITIKSRPNIPVDPIIVSTGFPITLYGDDLIDYFNINNLEFYGLTKSEYQRTGKLPEGVYRFVIEALDYNRATVVSNKGSATAWIVLNDAPIVNLPANNSKIRIVDPTNIAFTWTPRHTGSPNSAFTTEYVFRLIEIWPADRNPNDAFLSQLPLYEVETTQSQIVYGPAEPSLIPGRKYAWQVQARDTEGRDLFRNNGKSEVFVFQFGDAIEMPQNVRKELANATTISIRWEPSPNGEIPERFRIRFRPLGGGIWYENVTTQYYHTLSSLQNNKVYEIQVRAETARQASEYTFPQQHSTTLPIVDENFQCGSPFDLQPAVMTTPLQFLNVGDVFKCADFDHVQVTEVTKLSSPGGFAGRAYARVNYFNSANIEVTFSGTFNSEYQLVTGSMTSTYQKGSRMHQLAEEMKKIGEEKPKLGGDSAIVNPESTLIIISAAVDSVYVNDAGEIVVVEEDGTTTKYEQKKNAENQKQEMIVEDKNGEKWVVDKDGNVSQAENAIASAYASRDSVNFVVSFRGNTSQQYGFDSKQDDLGAYEKTTIHGEDFNIAWKAVEQGKQDFVDAFVDGAGEFPSKVGFKMFSEPVSFQPGNESGTRKLIIPGGYDGDKDELVAYATIKESGSKEEEVVLGKLKVVTYEYIARKVVVVPVNSATTLSATTIQGSLNNIYGQAVAGWQVTIDPVFTIEQSYIDELDEEHSGDFASYNAKMRAFNKQYKNSRSDYDRDAFYIFLIKGTDFKYNGFMPFKRGFGYIFIDKTPNVTKTIAHELGHGAFNLRHPFSEFPSVSQGSTDNLMDYKADGKVLKKYQWDNIHNPESMIGWLQDDEEGALYQNVPDPKIISRAEWGANEADKSKGYEEIEGSIATFYNQIVVHHSGNATNYPTVKQVQVEEMEKGYADIAYHFAIDASGNIYEGRPLNIKGAHVKGQTRGIGIVLLSDLDTKDSGLNAAQKAAEQLMGDGKTTDPMVQSLIDLSLYIRKKYKLHYLGGHKEVHKEEGTSRNCPGNIGLELVGLIRKTFKFYNPGE